MGTSTRARAAPRISQHSWWTSARHIGGVLMLLLFGTFIAVAAWTGPREAAPIDLDFREGGYVVLRTEPQPLHQLLWSGSGLEDQLTAASSQGNVVVWATSDHHVRYTRLEPQDPRLASLQRAPRLEASPDPVAMARLTHRLGSALALITFVVIVVGPVPRAGSRWYWFWLLWAPLGLGVLWFAITELVRGPRQRPRRRSGLEGAVTAIGLSVGVGLAFAVLAGL